MKFTHLRHLYQNPAFWFFAIFFFIGLFSFTDYGLGWDDEWSRTATGYANFNYIFNGDNNLLTNNEKYHGPFVELILVFAEKISGFQLPRSDTEPDQSARPERRMGDHHHQQLSAGHQHRSRW